MTKLYFPMEYATEVEWDGEIVKITQYDGQTHDELGSVLLSRHQFDELFEHKDLLFNKKGQP